MSKQLSSKVVFLFNKLKVLKQDLDCQLDKLRKLHNLKIGNTYLEDIFHATMSSRDMCITNVIGYLHLTNMRFSGELSQYKTLTTNNRFIKSFIDKIVNEICPKIKVIFDLVNIIYNILAECIKQNDENILIMKSLKMGIIPEYVFEEESGNLIKFGICENAKYFQALIYCNYDVRLFKKMTLFERSHLYSLEKKTQEYNKFRKELEIKYSLYNKHYETLVIEETNKFLKEIEVFK